MKIASSVTDLIGRTPLLELRNLEEYYGLQARVIAKLESFNPAGSAKDRVAASMIEDAEQRGVLKKGAVIIEPTSGNTGIGLASVAAAKGYRVVLTMPETMSAERRALLSAYGAELVLTDGARGMQGAIEKARELARQTPGAFLAGQFDNPANPDAHYRTTGPEIWEDTGGAVDYFVAGVGTGGSMTGVGRYLKEKNNRIRVVAVEPAESPVLSGGTAGAHLLQGIGAGFAPANWDRSLCDEILPIPGRDAYRWGRELARREGVLAGITSGAAVAAAVALAKRPECRGKLIVALLPDTGERYLTTPGYLNETDQTPGDGQS